MLTSTSGKLAGLAIALLLVVMSFAGSLAFGQFATSFSTLMRALLAYDPASTSHLIIVTERLPRAIVAVLVGASLAVSGALMQSLTRNALASPGILGINAGAMLFVVISAAFFTDNVPASLIWAAFMGAATAGSIVYFLGREPGAGSSPLRTVLAGVAVSALFVSFAQGLLVVNQERFGSLVFWLAGSVSGRGLDMLWPMLPLFAGASVICVFLTRQLNVLSLDDEVVRALGQRTGLVRLTAGLVVIVLSGASVALAGMIGFIGLIVPHITRGVFGRDHRWLLPGCTLLGASLLLIADTAARFVIPPQEVPVGVMTALLGAPLFLYLASRRSQSL
ncbi:iron ABC transporter permease [Marinobacter sp. BGYM27]|uniref:FecCD family ABC transporter permease n=1 Tax=unclassified Marinobacter TaxID=83889 RepID=UPI0021A744DE|nr:iron ABC transporter permease [Marinobacter sp. BGYM27]MDG5499595.1 iron ABC transporter permease [Marinobacter sp. BGYM27]